MKTRIPGHDATPSHAAAHTTPTQRRIAHEAAQLRGSERLVAQRQQVEAHFGAAAQRQEVPEEELQMKALQREAGPLEEELPAQGKFAPVAQRMSGEEEEMPAQGRFQPVQARSQENQTGMPDTLKSGIESLSGMDMSSVRVHRNSEQPAQLNALAYAQGNDIHLAPGQEQHLPHEAWHVVQQRQGRVAPTAQLQGREVNDDPALESEADAMGARALAAGHGSQG